MQKNCIFKRLLTVILFKLQAWYLIQREWTIFQHFLNIFLDFLFHGPRLKEFIVLPVFILHIGTSRCFFSLSPELNSNCGSKLIQELSIVNVMSLKVLKKLCVSFKTGLHSHRDNRSSSQLYQFCAVIWILLVKSYLSANRHLEAVGRNIFIIYRTFFEALRLHYNSK